MSGFKKFLLRGNVVDLAVAVIVGAAFGTVVASFVKNLLTPLISIPGKKNFAALHFTIHGSTFHYGTFLNDLIAFVVVATVVYYFVVLPVNTLLERFKPTPEEPAPVKDCSECLSSIPAAARKCAFCASPQTA